MSGQTITQKILAKASGKNYVEEGEIIYPNPDLLIAHDMHIAQFLQKFKEKGIKSIKNPEKLAVIIDHEVPARNIQSAERAKNIRQLVKEYEISNFFDVGRGGITHILQLESGLVKPGSLVITKDVHSTTAGALGSLAICLVYDFPDFLVNGTSWLMVPETIKVEFTGSLVPGVYSRDLAHLIIKDLGSQKADYKVIEFGGLGVSDLNIDSRATLCNVMVEIGAKSALVIPDQKVIDYLNQLGVEVSELPNSDQKAKYTAVVEYNLDSLEPQVAIPPSPDVAVPVSQMIGLEVHQAYIGSCASGTLSDLRTTAMILKNRKVNSQTRLIVIPSTQNIYVQALREGLLETIVEAGGMVYPPSCGPCYGGVAPMAAGENCISTATRNEPGRMGSMDAKLYLGSAATVASAAVRGHIVDPREML